MAQVGAASWHPAFRPNAEKDIVAASPFKPQTISQPELPTTTKPNAEPSHHDWQIRFSTEEEATRYADEQLLSAAAIPPVERVAWDTSVEADDEELLEAQSPGAVPEPNDIPELQQVEQRFRETDIPEAVAIPASKPADVESPSEDEDDDGTSSIPLEEETASPPQIRSHDNKHLSTMSFTRTVSGLVDFGEEDEVDAEWNLNPPQSDPWKNVAQTSRTNSFPTVIPAAHAPAQADIQPLRSNEAEDIMQEMEQESKDIFDDEDDVEDSFFAQHNEAADTSMNEPTSETYLNEGHSYGGEIPGALDSEQDTRFEEGLPLFQAEGNDEAISTAVNAFGDDENDDFFASAGQSDQPEHAPLERKSTNQVLDSIHYQPQEAREDAIEEEALSIEPSNVEEETDDVEKWKALLDDELLEDDDDLLPDDEDEVLPINSQSQDIADLFGSDDEGFLDDTDEPILDSTSRAVNGQADVSTNRPTSSDRYTPAGFSNAKPQNPYAPSSLLQDLSQQNPFSSTPPAFSSPTTANFQPPPQPRPDVSKAQSFADKAKGGYASPYDLPMDVVKPRKRPASNQPKNVYTAPPVNTPPPRSSSIYSNQSAQSTTTSPPASSHSNHPQTQQQPPAQLPKTVRKTQSGFFEDLPVTAKPRLPLRHASSFVSPSPGLQGHSPTTIQPPPRGVSPYAPLPQAQEVAPHSGLVAPERVSPYAVLPSGSAAVPPVASRYSPAPQQGTQSAPPPVVNPRYSPAPPSQKQIPPPVAAPIYAPPPPLPHMPRTSSPLAHFERSQDPRQLGEPASYERRTSSNYESALRTSHLPPTDELDENDSSIQPPPQSMRQTPPPPRAASSTRSTMSPPKRATSNYVPQPQQAAPHTFAPPQRSQTQSPGASFAGPRLGMTPADPYHRPSSVEGPQSPRGPAVSHSNVPVAQNRPRGFSTGLNYIAPTDGRERDPLQRWRGAPVFVWGVGGTLVTSFPQDVPRYGAGQTIPMVIRSPGEVKLRNIKEIDPLAERLTSFPGPLKGKSKKKELITWLSAGINNLEQEATYLRSSHNLSHDDKRVEERILLWKILRVFIENDGVLEGNPVVNKAIRDILSPDVENAVASAAPLYATGASLSGITASASGSRLDPADAASVEELRKHLLQGEREKAVWEAVDKRLWAHALLISNTVSKDLYKQVAQEFVQKEVRSIGENTESLAALYDIFSGNFEESIDELVPPSARAGFQMISTSKVPAAKDALEGLDRWRETLGLVLSNRSPDDSLALNALGKLLSGYGRAEAGHICFLFARSHTVFGGVDDPAVNVVLIGADHLRQPHDFDKELEPVLLSEVFEYGMSLSNTSNIPTSSPHLTAYKLQHATVLAEYGHRERAIQYCDAINLSVNSQTRRSPYHHPVLVEALDDLYKRLKQSPKDESSSWISKPSMDKVGGSLLATFNKFVAGDNDDAASTGSGAGSASEIGPFAMIAGGTPNISRSPSKSDLYGSYGPPTNSIPIPTTAAGSRYAPGGQFAPSMEHQGSYNSQPRNSYDGRSSGELRRTEPQRQQADYRPSSQHSNTYAAQQSPSLYAPHGGYSPYSPHQEEFKSGNSYQPQTSNTIINQPLSPYDAPQPRGSFDGLQPSNSFSEPSSRQVSSGYQPQTFEPSAPSSFEPPSFSGYEPSTEAADQSSPSGDEVPSSSGYEPPAYQPYEPAAMDDEPESPVERPKKKSFMDDDDDDIPALKKQPVSSEKTKAEKDREADEAFRKAAEADGKKCFVNAFIYSS